MKVFKTVLICIAMCMALSTGAFAVNDNSTVIDAYNMKPGTETQTEQTKWVYKYTINGEMEKRLWSITRGIWLTDWIPC